MHVSQDFKSKKTMSNLRRARKNVTSQFTCKNLRTTISQEVDIKKSSEPVPVQLIHNSGKPCKHSFALNADTCNPLGVVK